MLRPLIRYAAYPTVFGAIALTMIVMTAQNAPYWPWFPLLAGLGVVVVGMLERVAPYEAAWLADHDDLATDLLHNAVNLSLLLLTVEAMGALRELVALPGLWPHDWPVWAEVFLAGAVIDFGLYAMHRASHHVPWLWRLHTVHHSSERLYWLNGERRHPFHALILAGPGLAVVLALGAPAAVVSCWLSLLTVHLAFQHANLDYTVGPLRRWLGVAESHRWHHKRDYEDAQVNFGEFWLIWDRLFGTAFDDATRVGADAIGLSDRTFPRRYAEQLRWPFRTTPRRAAPSDA